MYEKQWEFLKNVLERARMAILWSFINGHLCAEKAFTVINRCRPKEV